MAALAAAAEEVERVAELAGRFPGAPEAELLRFCRAKCGHPVEEAARMYEEHLRWSRHEGSPERLQDATRIIPPKYLRQSGVARDGSPLLYVQGARFEEGIAPEQYMLACAQTLAAAVPRDDLRRVTVLIDVRPGEGWPNVPARKMLPFFSQCSHVLAKNYPERLQRVIVYPMPWLVQHLWVLLQGMMDPVTRSKFVLLGGSGSLGAPCPAELGDYVSLDQLPADAQGLHKELAMQN